MRKVKVGKYFVPSWLIIAVLISGIAASTYYIWQRLTIPVEVKEPLEIISYPTQLSLYPGETTEFNVTIINHASVNYSVVLDFSLDNTTYQENYVTFSNEVYIIIPGIQNITAWLKVEPHAPPTNASLIIQFKRTGVGKGVGGVIFFDDFNDGIAEGWIQNMGTWDVIGGEYRVSVPGVVEDGISTVDALNLTDCVVEVRVRFADDVGFRAGIIFRYIDNGHYYSFELSNEYDGGQLFRYDPSDPHYGHGLAVASYPIDKNVEYLIRVEIKGNTFKCFINGIEVCSGTDGTYCYGKVGLRASRAIAYFDDFKVSQIP